MGMIQEIFELKQLFLKENGENPNVLYMTRTKENELILQDKVGSQHRPREYFPDGIQGMIVVWDAEEFKVDRVSIKGDWVSEEMGEVYVARLMNHKGEVQAHVKGHLDIITGSNLLQRHGNYGRREFEKSILRYLIASSLRIYE